MRKCSFYTTQSTDRKDIIGSKISMLMMNTRTKEAARAVRSENDDVSHNFNEAVGGSF